MGPPPGVTIGVARCPGTRALGASCRRAASCGHRLQRPARQLVVLASSKGSGAHLSKTALKKLPKAELVKQLSDCGLDSTGTKPQLVDRLLEHLKEADGTSSTPVQDEQDEATVVPKDRELLKKRKAELIEICKASGLATRGTKADLVARILEHSEESLQPDWLGVPAADVSREHPALEQGQDAEFVTEEEYVAEREEVKAALLQKTKVQLQQMCLAHGLKKSARSKLELAERILQAQDDYVEEEELKERSKATDVEPESSVQMEIPPGISLEEGEEITRITDFRDLTKEDMPVYIGDMKAEIDTILKEMQQTYGKYLPGGGGRDGPLKPETAIPVGSLEAEEGPSDEDLKVLESESAMHEYSTSGADLLDDDVVDEGKIWSGSALEQQDAPAAAVQPSGDTTSIGDEDAHGEVTIRLDDDINGIDDDDLESEGFGVVSGEGVSPDMTGTSVEEEEQELQLRSRRRSRRRGREQTMEAKLLDLSGIDEKYPYDDDELERMVDASYLQEEEEEEEDADEEGFVDDMFDAEFADVEDGRLGDAVETVSNAADDGGETLKQASKMLQNDQDVPVSEELLQDTNEDDSDLKETGATQLSSYSDLGPPLVQSSGDRELDDSEESEIPAVNEEAMDASSTSLTDAPSLAAKEDDVGDAIPSVISEEAQALDQAGEPLYESPVAEEMAEDVLTSSQSAADVPMVDGAAYESGTSAEAVEESLTSADTVEEHESPVATDETEGESQSSADAVEESLTPVDTVEELETSAATDETEEGPWTSVGAVEESFTPADTLEELQSSAATSEIVDESQTSAEAVEGSLTAVDTVEELETSASTDEDAPTVMGPVVADVPVNVAASSATPSQAESTTEDLAAAESAAGPSDAASLQAEVVQGKKMIETLQEQISARKEALTQMQERIVAAESTQQYTVSQMERLLLVAENLKTQRSDWQDTMRGKVESLKEAAERIHETEQTKAVLASNLDELEEQLQELEKEAKEKDTEAEKLKLAINRAMEEQGLVQAPGYSNGNGNGSNGNGLGAYGTNGGVGSNGSLKTPPSLAGLGFDIDPSLLGPISLPELYPGRENVGPEIPQDSSGAEGELVGGGSQNSEENEEGAKSSVETPESTTDRSKRSNTTPGVAMAAGVLGFLDMVSSIFGDTEKKSTKERRKTEEEDNTEDS